MSIDTLSKEAAEILIGIGSIEIQPENLFTLISIRKSLVY